MLVHSNHWAFTTSTDIEYGRKIEGLDEEQVRLSPQHLMNWVCLEKAEDPLIGYTLSQRKAMRWVKHYGIATEAECPYINPAV